MRWPSIACLLLASLLPVSAEDWTTEDGHTYHNVTVVGQEDDGVRITYDGGVGKIPYYELPVDIQKRFGQDVDSLAAKKQAVDKAVEDAVNAAANAQVMPPAATPVQPEIPQSPNTAPSYVSPANPGPSGTPAATAPGAPHPTSTATTGPAGVPGKPGQVAPPGTTANTAHNPGVPPAPGAHPGAGGPAASTQPAEPISLTPQPSGVSGAGGKPLQLSVANYSYNASLDVCYLDSPPVDVYTGSAPKAPPGQGSSLTLRIVTDGRTPQQPDRYEVTFVCIGGSGGDLSSSDIVFHTDTGTFSVADADRKDSGVLPGGGQTMRYASFYLPAADVRQFCRSQQLSFSVGADTYHVDERGTLILRSYIGDIDTLQPATSSLMRSVYKWLSNIPSFFSILSTICEYVILGSFALLVAASIAAFILGISRFIKM